MANDTDLKVLFAGGPKMLTTNPRWQMATIFKQEDLAVASIARDDPSTLPGDDRSLHTL